MSRVVCFYVGCWSMLLCFAPAALRGAETVYMKPSEFLRSVFGRELPRMSHVTPEAAQAKRVSAILGRAYRTKRIRYWRRGAETAWILDNNGKTEPITVGYHVANGQIRRVEVLIYRESHGFEVARKSFLKQFSGARVGKGGLNCRIDGIAGATLSVRSLTRMARLALYLDSIAPK